MMQRHQKMSGGMLYALSVPPVTGEETEVVAAASIDNTLRRTKADTMAALPGTLEGIFSWDADNLCNLR